MIYSKLLCKNKFDFFELVIFTFRMSSIGFMKKDKKKQLILWQYPLSNSY